MTTSQETLPVLAGRLRYAIAFLFASIIFANLGGRMIEVYLPVYLAELGAGGSQIGFFFTALSAVLLLATVLGGAFADAFGHLRTVIAASLVGLGAFVLLAFAGHWTVVLAGVAVLYGTSKVVGPAIYAYVAEQIPEEKRVLRFGQLRRLIIGAGVLAPVLAGFLVSGWGIRWMLGCAALLYGLAVAARLVLVPMMKGGQQLQGSRAAMAGIRAGLAGSLKALWPLLAGGGVFLALLVADGFGDIAMSASTHFFPVFLTGRQVSMIQLGWIGGAFVAFEFVAISFSVRLSEKKGEKWAMLWGFLLQGICLLWFARAVSFWGYAAAWALVGAAQGMMTPAANALVARFVPENVRATSFGLIAGSTSLFSFLIPWASGWMYQHLSTEAPFYLAAVFAFAAVPVIFRKIPAGGRP